MIIVLGSVTVGENKVSEALELSKIHVARSRTEPGCISHAVYEDPDVKGKLVFLEKWSDQASLDEHFRVPESGEFVNAISKIAIEPPSISLFSAKEIEF